MGQTNPWAIAGVVVAIVLVVAGLAFVGLFVVALSSLGSNK